MSDHLDASAVARLISRMMAHGDAPAVDSDDGLSSYRELVHASDVWLEKLRANGVTNGMICGYIGEFNTVTISLFVALMRLGAITVPLTPAVEHELSSLAQLGGLERIIRFPGDEIEISTVQNSSQINPLVTEFRKQRHPGLIVFTSGSTGEPKAILHDLEKILSKFDVPRSARRTVLFLMMDHFGGINTLLSVLAYGGVGVCVSQRTPDAVCRSISRSRADLLPTTPTFLNMILASGAWRDHDLSSVDLITYGTEPMAEPILRRVREIFPAADFKQTYGLSELGVLHSQSPDPGSLWLRIGGEGFETKVVDGVLHIRSRSSMVGYLNAPSPIDEDGWMNTGDLVEERDGLIRFRGRKSEVINVGGQKVFPGEVEAILLEADNVVEAAVFGVRHPLLGQAVCARVSLAEPEDDIRLTERLKEYCRAHLAKFKVPLRFETASISMQSNWRTKKLRSSNDDPSRSESE